MAFDPNSLPSPKSPEWATYIADRRPKWKLHANRGQALQAAAYYPRETQIFRWDAEEDRWVEVWNGVVTTQSWNRGSKSEVCERCGDSTMRTRSYDRKIFGGGHESVTRTSNEGSWGWLATPTNKSKLVEPFQRVWLCRKCK